MASDGKSYSIRAVEKAVGLPRSTLYYYESQFPAFLRIPKTAGGHRRYTDYNVEQFNYLKEQLRERKLPVSEVRDVLTADTDSERLRKDIDLLLKISEEIVKDNKMLKASMAQMSKRLRQLEEQWLNRSNKKKFLKWFE